MSNFEWQTEEEVNWQPLPPDPKKPKTRQPIRLLSTLFFLVVAAAFLIYRQAILQIEAATESNTISLLSTAELLVQAEAEQDEDLLALLISGTDMGWVATQRALLTEQLMFDRASWGLTAVSSPTFSLESLSPDLLQAELTTRQEVTTRTADGTTSTFTLSRPLHLRRGESRWLLSPNIPVDFWGEVESSNGRFLTIFYPARDAQFMPALLRSLEAELLNACTTLPDIDCPTEASQPITVRFNQDPNALLNSGALHDTRFALPLPTPSLLGVPNVAEPATTLSRLYAPHVVAAALYRWNSGETCCEHPLFHQALVDKQLATLGLRAWPLQSSDYAQILASPLYGNNGLNDLWRLNSQPFGDNIAVTQTYALIDYLSQSNRDSFARMQQRIEESRDFYDWAQRYIVSSRFSNADYRDWLRFVIEQSEASTKRPSLPTQPIAMLCSPTNNDPTQLVQYDPSNRQFSTLLEDRRLGFLAPLPDDDGLLLLRRQAGRTEAVGALWQNDRLSPAIQTPLEGSVFRVDPIADQLLLYRFSFGAETADYSVLDPTNCDELACSSYPLPGNTVWSPARSQSLSVDSSGSIWLADSKGLFRQKLIGRGQAPFWLDEETIGYATRLEEPALVLQSADGDIIAFDPLTTLLEQTDLPTAMWQIHAVQPLPNGNDIAIALNTIDDTNETAVLLINPITNQLLHQHHPKFGFTPYSPFAFSPDERWLTIQSFNKDGAGWELLAIDLQTNNQFQLESRFPFTFPGYDWTHDSQWLLMVGDGIVQLFHPQTNHMETIVHDFSSCYFAAWSGR